MKRARLSLPATSCHDQGRRILNYRLLYLLITVTEFVKQDCREEVVSQKQVFQASPALPAIEQLHCPGHPSSRKPGPS